MHYTHNTPATNPPALTPYQEAYHLDDCNVPIDDHDSCPDCAGASGYNTSELQGDWLMTGPVYFFEPCPTCLGSELCPGCMQPLWLSYDQSALGEDSPKYTLIPHYTRINNEWHTLYEPAQLHTFEWVDAFSAIYRNNFICLVCGWSYDPDREYNDYDYDDYPTLDASDYFGDI